MPDQRIGFINHDKPIFLTNCPVNGPQSAWPIPLRTGRHNALWKQAFAQTNALVDFTQRRPDLLALHASAWAAINKRREHRDRTTDIQFFLRARRLAIGSRRAVFTRFAKTALDAYLAAHPDAGPAWAPDKHKHILAALKRHCVREWLAARFGNPDYVPA